MADQEAEQGFATLVGVVLEPLRRYLARRAPASLVDDVVGDVLLVLWRRRDAVPVDDPMPWAYAVARRCLANAERGARRQRRLAGKVAIIDPPREAAAPEPAGDLALASALASLRAQDAEVLRLWAWEDLRPAEIAIALDITPNAASIRLHRAKLALAERLGKERPRKEWPGAGHEGPREGAS